ncbi:MAG: dihydrodipicolinate reductase [Phycisphaeraceae bacterium]|nr:dihydrodipicolinate reductase [Phycisphaeraceae bacterium]
MQPIRIAQFGLGPIGLESVKYLATKPWAQIIGGIDIDPLKQEQSLGRLTGITALDDVSVYASFDDLCEHAKPDVVLHTAGSSVVRSIEQIMPMVKAGAHVASTCEPLLYPWLTAPQASAELDAACMAAGVSVVGTGVNPGFVMDLLPVVMTGVSTRIDRIKATRVVDATTRRGPLQKKIGSGLEPETFQSLFQQGKAGHAGFCESAALLAHSMGWHVTADDIVETLEPVVADKPIKTEHVTVEPGQTRGLHQMVKVMYKGELVIDLDLTMALCEETPHDTVTIEGAPNLTLTFPDGVPGDQATVASLINSVPRLITSKPGLRLMTELASPIHDKVSILGGSHFIMPGEKAVS